MLNDAVNGFDIRYLGVSNWSFERIKKANDYASKKGLKPIIASQLQYSIARVNKVPDDIFVMTPEEYEKYCKTDLNIFGFSAQAKGFFAILAEHGAEKLSQSHKEEFLNNYNLELFERLHKMANEKGISVATLVVSALINNPDLNTFAQIGPTTIEQLSTSLSAAEVTLTDSERNYLLNIN